MPADCIVESFPRVQTEQTDRQMLRRRYVPRPTWVRIGDGLIEAMRRREVVVSAVVAAVASAVLLAYRAMNPGGAAEIYFAAHEHHAAAHRLMQICYVVVMSAAAFNLRFVAVELLRPVLFEATV